MQTAQDLYRQSRRAALGGLIVTLSLGIAKLLGGWFGNSLALLSDSFHSFGDALSSGSILIALYWSQRPADQEHPYGHSRIESIAASNVALALIASAIWIAVQAIHSWNESVTSPDWYTLIIAAASIIANELIFRYSVSVANQSGSKAVKASAWDQRLDVFGSLIVFLSLMISIWGGPKWHFVDHVAALIVAVTIVVAGASIFWGSLQDLMDRQADPELLAQIRKTALETPGVKGIEKLLVRRAGLEHLVDIHVEVEPEITVHEGHEIGHNVKDRLISHYITIKDVLVHIEPFHS
jgi:cation diffusion facilitator family transporter